MPHIKVRDINMHMEVQGKGEPLVLISGFSADKTIWDDVLKDLSPHFQVVLFDNRGAGQTDVPPGPYEILQMAEDVVYLLKAMDITAAHIVGSSMGGYIAQTLAYHYPHLVRSLILANTAMKTATPFHYHVEAQYQLRKAGAPAAALIQSACAWAFSYSYLSKADHLTQLIQWSLDNPYAFTLAGHEAQYAALDKFDSSQWVSEIQSRTLVMTADEDIILSPKLSMELHEALRDAQLVTFQQCGHLPMIEQPREFAKHLLKFIKEGN